MLGSENIPLLGQGNMGVDFRDVNGTMPQHFLNVSDVHICLQKTGGKGMVEHMGSDMKVNRSQGDIFIDHAANRLIGYRSLVLINEDRLTSLVFKEQSSEIRIPVAKSNSIIAASRKAFWRWYAVGA